MPLLLTRRQAAEALGVSTDTIDRLITKGQFRPTRIFADQDHEKVETMAGGIDHAVGRGTAAAQCVPGSNPRRCRTLRRRGVGRVRLGPAQRSP
jgi:hypothetical protein